MRVALFVALTACLLVRGGHAAAQTSAAPPAPAVGAPAASSTAPSVRPATPSATDPRFDYRLRPRALGPGVWVVEGAEDDFALANGCNIINTGFIATGAGVVVINTGVSRRYGEQLRAAIASVTAEPVVKVLNLNHHPDYFLGNQAFDPVTLAATPATVDGIRAESAAYEDNLYRLCGDWMADTRTVAPAPVLQPGPLTVGGRTLELIELDGHTRSDLVVVDRTSGVVFAGGLVFVDRAPTAPHADLDRWSRSLDRLGTLEWRAMVPSHGPVVSDRRGLAQTRDWVDWLQRTLRASAAAGLELNEVTALPRPARFATMKAWSTEHPRTIAVQYPRYERDALTRRR